MGRQTVIAIQSQDLATVEGIVTIVTFVVLALNVIVHVLYAWIDPRIRLS